MGTLNISIAPWIFSMKAPAIIMRQVAWNPQVPPEDFSFSACQVIFQQDLFEGWVYYPHPETKQWHFQAPDILEVITTEIPRITYGREVTLQVNPAEITVTRPL